MEKYPDVKFAEIGQQAKTISLENVQRISKTSNDGKKCMIEIQPEEGPQRLLLFADGKKLCNVLLFTHTVIIS